MLQSEGSPSKWSKFASNIIIHVEYEVIIRPHIHENMMLFRCHIVCGHPISAYMQAFMCQVMGGMLVKLSAIYALIL